MSTNLYHISDELQNLIDWTNIYKMPRYAGGHDEQMKGLFIGAKVLHIGSKTIIRVLSRLV